MHTHSVCRGGIAKIKKTYKCMLVRMYMFGYTCVYAHTQHTQLGCADTAHSAALTQHTQLR